MGLLDVDYKENNPGVKVFPYMAFTPLICKIVERLLEGEWNEPSSINKTGHPGLNMGKKLFKFCLILKETAATFCRVSRISRLFISRIVSLVARSGYLIDL